jgi:hypothetical protein
LTLMVAWSQDSFPRGQKQKSLDMEKEWKSPQLH